MGKQIQFDDAARAALRRGVDQLAGAVRVTLGPRGRNVVIGGGAGGPTITNDGLTIAREIELEDPFENMGAQLVKEVAFKTGQTAGDGTTTATVLAHALVSRGLGAITAGHNPMAMKRGIDRAVTIVVQHLQKQSRQVKNRADIARVAALSAHSDNAIGEMIAEAMDRVGRRGVITVSEGRGMETTLEVVEGVRFERGYVSPYFITDAESMNVQLTSALVLLTDFKLTTAQQIMRALEAAANAGRPLLVIADDIEGEALATLVVNRLRGTLASVAVRAPDTGDRRRQMLEDLSVLTGAKLYSSDLGGSLERFEPAHFGRAKRVLVESDTTTLMRGGGRAGEIRDRIAALEHEVQHSDSDYDLEWLRERLGRLTGGVAVIRVGAPTEIEMNERKSRVEDALAATQAAVEEGVVPGGGVALVRAQASLRTLRVSGGEKMGVQLVHDALEAPARQIAVNAGEDPAVVVERIRAGTGWFGFNAMNRTYGDLDELGIVDPTKVARVALQNAASIGALVLTTDAIVVDAPDDEDEETGEE